MKIFLYTYSVPENFEISQRLGVFGTPVDRAGLAGKVRQLRRGDLIVVRDGTQSALRFLGHCKVVGDVFDQSRSSPFKELLWNDECVRGHVIYRLRVAVDFEDVPRLSLGQVSWPDLDALHLPGAKGHLLQGRQMWGKKLAGNYLRYTSEIDAFLRLVSGDAA